MKETTIDEVQEKADSWQSEGKSWHFHMLTLDCSFNERKDQHAFILENRTDNETYVVYSKERYMGVGQKLVKMLHGNKVAEETKEDTPITNETMKIIVQKAEDLNSKNISWHHHMLFPDCEFNKHKGKWNVAFEDKESGQTLEALYDEEPTKDLRNVEVLFYKQKK